MRSVVRFVTVRAAKFKYDRTIVALAYFYTYSIRILARMDMDMAYGLIPCALEWIERELKHN